MKTFEEQLKKARELKMTTSEKNVMRYRIASFIDAHPGVARLQPTPSPYMHRFFSAPLMRGFAFAVVILLAGGSTLAFASQNALPGDPLYAVKNVTENIHGALLFNTEAKTAWQASLVEQRVTEISTLSIQGRLQNGPQAAAQVAFTENSNALSESLAKLSLEGKHDVSVAVINQLRPSLEKIDAENTVVAENNQTTATPANPAHPDGLNNATGTPENGTAIQNQNNQTGTADAKNAGAKAFAMAIHVQNEKILAQAEIGTSTVGNGDSQNQTAQNGSGKNTASTGENKNAGESGGSNAQSTAGVNPQNNATSSIGASTLLYGTLKGKADIGPICPVEQIGVPCPVPVEAYTSRSIIVFTKDTHKEVLETHFKADGTYQIQLPAGTYTIELAPNGIDHASGLPKDIIIQSGETIELNLSIDTGIRTPQIAPLGQEPLSPGAVQY